MVNKEKTNYTIDEDLVRFVNNDARKIAKKNCSKKNKSSIVNKILREYYSNLDKK